MPEKVWLILLLAGAALLLVFALLAASFEANPGYGPCPRPPPCGGGEACLVSTCPQAHGWTLLASLVAGIACLAAGVLLGSRARHRKSDAERMPGADREPRPA